MSIYDRPIEHHGGAKYLRTIHPADGVGQPIKVDVYNVIEAYRITCPAMQHALKKLLCTGQRGKGTVRQDIEGIFDALWRALDLLKDRDGPPSKGEMEEVVQEFFKEFASS